MKEVIAHWIFENENEADYAHSFLSKTVIGWSDYASRSGRMITVAMDSFATNAEEFTEEQKEYAKKVAEWTGSCFGLEITESTTQRTQYNTHLA